VISRSWYNSVLKDYCTKMKSNPLFIKWFVSCVHSGKRPEEALLNSNIFLDYCLANVVGFLSQDARLVAKAMLATSGPHTQPILSYLTNLDGQRLQIALQQLITANIAMLIAQPTENGITSLYELADLPRAYFLRAYPPCAVSASGNCCARRKPRIANNAATPAPALAITSKASSADMAGCSP